MLGNPEKRKALRYAGFASLGKPQPRPIYHSSLEQVSGSNPLVGSLFYLDLQVKCRTQEKARTLAGPIYSNRTLTCLVHDQATSWGMERCS